MMQLLGSLGSPFVRKARMAAIMKGVMDRIEMVPTEAGQPVSHSLRNENPLHKIPVLVLEDGTQLYDSKVICEYIDTLQPAPALFPKSGRERVLTLRLGSLCDGVLEAAVLIIYEKRFRPEDKWVQSWVDRQQAKIDAALGWLEPDPPGWTSHPDYGHIALAAALGYLDFRFQSRWRAGHPRLVSWLDRFAKAVPAFEATKPPG
jgi:glutathione S-transferase